jgi:hypothetical protein
MQIRKYTRATHHMTRRGPVVVGDGEYFITLRLMAIIA